MCIDFVKKYSQLLVRFAFPHACFTTSTGLLVKAFALVNTHKSIIFMGDGKIKFRNVVAGQPQNVAHQRHVLIE